MKPYQCGDVVIIDVPMLANSHIQAGKRPWVVVQNNVGNQFSSTSIVVPLTTKIKRLELPTHVAVTWGSLQPSMVECEQVRVVDHESCGHRFEERFLRWGGVNNDKTRI